MKQANGDQNYAFFKFMHDIVDAGIWSQLSNSSRALYPVLCSFTNEQFSFVWPATTELLRLTGFKTKKPLQQARKELMALGLIDYIPGSGHNSSRYYFRFDYAGSRIHLDTYRETMRSRRGRQTEPPGGDRLPSEGGPGGTPNNNPNNIHINIHNHSNKLDQVAEKLESVEQSLEEFAAQANVQNAQSIAESLMRKYGSLAMGKAIKIAINRGKSGDLNYLESIVEEGGRIEIKHRTSSAQEWKGDLSEEQLIELLSPKYIYKKTLYCEELTDTEYEQYLPECQRHGYKLKRVSAREQKLG